MNARSFSFALVFALIPACSGNAPDDIAQPDDGTTDTSTSDLSLCKKTACGPALGLASIVCADGSTGGNTGRCLRDHGTCGWEIRECPKPKPTSCSAPGACGPALGMPNYLCSDGKTWAGPTGHCLDKGGVCGWEIATCPTPPPPPPPRDCSAPNACGPQLGMPNYLCPDGKTVAGPGPCVDNGTSCGWQIISCPK